jgi:hypothetical protein
MFTISIIAQLVEPAVHVSEQGNKNLIGPNPIRQPGARDAYKGSLAPATS